jgi:NAD(P)-dependent dehydrogenase (short-subunit alcohol dehydrogenase family)
MGGATVRRFAATGDRVVIVDRNAALAEQLADELRQTHPAWSSPML